MGKGFRHGAALLGLIVTLSGVGAGPARSAGPDNQVVVSENFDSIAKLPPGWGVRVSSPPSLGSARIEVNSFIFRGKNVNGGSPQAAELDTPAIDARQATSVLLSYSLRLTVSGTPECSIAPLNSNSYFEVDVRRGRSLILVQGSGDGANQASTAVPAGRNTDRFALVLRYGNVAPYGIACDIQITVDDIVVQLDDGIDSATDNCPTVANKSQADTDGDGVGDACDRTVSLRYSATTHRFSGALGGPVDAACRNAGHTVTIFKDTVDPDTSLGDVPTNDRGAFIKSKRARPGRYYASVPVESTPACPGGRSRNFRVT